MIMNYVKQTVTDVSVKGKRVLLRCDFNVPLDKSTNRITDDNRIIASLPTIRYLLEQGARVIICSHLGRPKGKIVPEMSLLPCAQRLSALLDKYIPLVNDITGEYALKMSESLKNGGVMMLENLRFYPEEEQNDPEFAKKLAALADIYVSDAFGAAHRAHASTAGVAQYLPAYAGLLIDKELSAIGDAINNPKRPFVAILGGSKISDKLGVIRNLLNKADKIIIGGGMAYTFIKARGGSIGNSICDEEKLQYCKEVLDLSLEKGVEILLPEDSRIAAEINAPEFTVAPSGKIPDGLAGFDIGPTAEGMICRIVADAKTIIWNGPMGAFEFAPFSGGTQAVTHCVADSGAITIVGGGDSAAAVRKFGLEHKMTHVSTGGGATLEFMEGRVLPGIACLLDK